MNLVVNILTNNEASITCRMRTVRIARLVLKLFVILKKKYSRTFCNYWLFGHGPCVADTIVVTAEADLGMNGCVNTPSLVSMVNTV